MIHANRIRAACSFALLLWSVSPAHSAIFDRDDRQFASATATSPYAPVGVVSGGVVVLRHSTGFLVDECHVLTSRAVVGHTRSPLDLRLKFKAAIGTRDEVSSSGTVVAAGGQFPRNRTSSEQYDQGGQDWLLVKLDKCLGSSLGYAILKSGPFSPYEFNNLQSAGYPDGRQKRAGITLDPSCRITGARGTVWLNDCATVRGDAGDPIFRVSNVNGKPRMEVYAIQSAGYLWKGPAAWEPTYANQAIPAWPIASSIMKSLGQTR